LILWLARSASLVLVLVKRKEWYPARRDALRRWSMRESQTVNEWKREGVVEQLRRMLRWRLERKFAPLPQALLDRIEATSDVDRLDEAIDQAGRLDRLEDLAL
jgi:hypothetical protein